MCSRCRRPQAPAALCRFCGAPLPESPSVTAAGTGSRGSGVAPGSRVFELGARGGLRLVDQRLELFAGGVSLAQAQVRELRSVQLVRRPVLPLVALVVVGGIGALLPVGIVRWLALAAGAAGALGLLLIQRYVIRFERQDRTHAQLELGVLPRGTAEQVAVERAWRNATPDLRAAGVPIEEAR